MRFGFGFRSTNSSSGGSSSGGGSHGGINGGGHLSRGRSSKKLTDDRPFPPQLEEHPYFNYFPTTQQNYYTRYSLIFFNDNTVNMRNMTGSTYF